MVIITAVIIKQINIKLVNIKQIVKIITTELIIDAANSASNFIKSPSNFCDSSYHKEGCSLKILKNKSTIK